MVANKKVTKVIQALEMFCPWTEFGYAALGCQAVLLNGLSSQPRVAFFQEKERRLFLLGENSLRGVIAGEYNIHAHNAATALRLFKVVTGPELVAFGQWFWDHEAILRVNSDRHALEALVKKYPEEALHYAQKYKK